MKKLFYLLLVAAAFTFASCGNKAAEEEAKVEMQKKGKLKWTGTLFEEE